MVTYSQKGKTDMTKIQTGLRIEPELRRKLMKLAEREGRSLNNYMTVVLKKHVKRIEEKEGKPILP